jgi:uncharacterized protein YidB (DUF937 family)
MQNFDKIALYGTEGCHLCDVAAAEIRQALCAFPDQQIGYVDIVDSDELIKNYAERIPVLVNELTGNELEWPFTAEDVKSWLMF